MRGVETIQQRKVTQDNVLEVVQQLVDILAGKTGRDGDIVWFGGTPLQKKDINN